MSGRQLDRAARAELGDRVCHDLVVENVDHLQLRRQEITTRGFLAWSYMVRASASRVVGR